VTPSRWRYLTAWWASASGDCAAYQRPTPRRSERAPAAEPLHELGEQEQVRSGPADPRQRLERRTPGRLVTEARGHRQGEDRRIVLRRPSLVAQARDLGDRPRAVGRQASLHGLGVLARELPLGRVVTPALRAEDQEAAEPRPVVHGPGEAAGGVGHMARAADGLRLGRPARKQALEIGHGTPPLRVGRFDAAVVLRRQGLFRLRG